MERVMNNGICRCCASEGTFKDLLSKHQWMGEDEIYADMLRECFDINLSTNENGEDGGICEVCITQLRNASNFKKQVLQTEEQFKKGFADRIFKNNIVKVEAGPIDYDDNVSEDNNLSDDFSSPEDDLPIKAAVQSIAEYDMPIKTEVEESKGKKRGRATTSRAKKSKLEDGETSKSIRTIKSESNRQPVQSTRHKLEFRVPEISKQRANVRMILQCSNATPIRCHGGIGYACCFCAEQYPNPADLKTHNLEYHDDKSKLKFMKDKCLSSFIVKLDITALSCTICYKTIDTVEELTAHLVKEHGKIIYADVKSHIVPFKFLDKTLRCVVCSIVFNKFKALLEHMNTHYRNYICDICDAGYVTRCMLSNHSEVHKMGKFKCRYCDKVYDTQRKRRSHEKCVHIYMNMLNKCGYCNEKFKDYHIKEKHIAQVHGIASIELKCQACDKTFPSQRALNTHTKRDHLLERRHKCDHCDMKFYNANELKNHVVKHTGVKLFQCNVCLKSYGRKKTLAEHMRIHADDRRFKCEHCGQSFVQKCSWRGHMRSKHGEVV